MIVLVSLIVLLRRLLVPTVFRMVHPYISIHSFLHLFHVFWRSYSAYKFISSFHLPPVVGDEKNTKYKTHSKLGEREDSIQGTVNL